MKKVDEQEQPELGAINMTKPEPIDCCLTCASGVHPSVGTTLITGLMGE